MVGRYSCRQQRDGAETLYGCTYRRFGGGLCRYGHLLRLFGRGASAYRGWRFSFGQGYRHPRPRHFSEGRRGALLPALSRGVVQCGWIPRGCRCRAGELLCVGLFVGSAEALFQELFRDVPARIAPRTYSAGVFGFRFLPVRPGCGRGRRCGTAPVVFGGDGRILRGAGILRRGRFPREEYRDR